MQKVFDKQNLSQALITVHKEKIRWYCSNRAQKSIMGTTMSFGRIFLH